jgi:hypothetical protein
LYLQVDAVGLQVWCSLFWAYFVYLFDHAQ